MASGPTVSPVPHLPLAHLPTPLEPLDRLSAELRGPRIWVKRDDATGLAIGGNKVRKLEYLLADAVDQGADVVLTTGATQSNHCRQTAAAAAKLGLRCELLLEHRFPAWPEAYNRSGNLRLDRLFGATVLDYEKGTDMVGALGDRVGELLDAGHRPYAIPPRRVVDRRRVRLSHRRRGTPAPGRSARVRAPGDRACDEQRRHPGGP